METCEDCGQMLPFHLERCPQMSGDSYPAATWPGGLTYEQYQSVDLGGRYEEETVDFLDFSVPESKIAFGPLATGLPTCASCFTGKHYCGDDDCECPECDGIPF